jgi:5-methylthioadenosine/S-adenosylhomocysteine deaminase
VKTVIKNLTILPLTSAGELISGSILIEEGLIKAIGEVTIPSGARIIDGYNHLALPPLVNNHTHLSMVYFRNYGSGYTSLQGWLEAVWALEDRLQEDDIFSASLLGIGEMILSGTCHFRDMYFFPEGTANAVRESKVRANLGLTLFGDLEETHKRLERLPLFREWASESLLSWDIAPHSIYTCSEATLRKGIEVAQREGVALNIHASETAQEVEEALEKFGLSPIAYLQKLGIGEVASLLPHCVHLLESDYPILRDLGATVVHNPSSNAKLGCGIAPLKRLVDEDIRVTLGSDGAASNNALDMFNELRLAGLLASASLQEANALSPFALLKMATAGATLEVGGVADLILIDLDKPHLTPLNDPFSALLYSAKSSDVEYLFCNGELLMEKRELLTIELERRQSEVKKIWEGILQR